jgi:hypothetical protein
MARRKPQVNKNTAASETLLEAMPASKLIEARFKEDTDVQKTFTEHLAARAQHAVPRALRADAAFTEFAPSKFTARERTPRRYLAPGENLATAMSRLVQDAATRIRKEDNRQGLKLIITEDTKSLLKNSDGDITLQAIELPVLLEILAAKQPAALTLREEPALTACLAKRKAQQRLDEIEGKKPAAPENNDRDSDNNDEQTEQPDTKAFVTKQVHNLLARVPSPEEPPILAPPAAADHGQVKQNIQNFELRSGPSDVTAYHDFNSLQIAFEHVWAEVFDERLGQMGRELYNTYVELLDFVGNPVDPSTGLPLAPPDAVNSIADITSLIQNASMLGRVTENVTPPSAITPEFLRGYEAARKILINMFKIYDPADFPNDDIAAGLVDGSLAPLRQQIELATARAAENKALATTLPAVQRLQALLAEMRDLLSKPYAFTVYKEASCNFGIMVTYRQSWEPEQYQVGDLVSTIPLAPKEVRRYTTKQVTKTSRAKKEIANNINTIRNDIGTTGRADQDIVNRAENRTNFKVTADGTFGVEGDKIHATAEGGGDSAKISESTKKDFHEAVLKSAHEYRQENRTEVDTTSSTESETTSFNEIQNPNDELTVTYLFYELQRTYFIREKIHQVVPVVLVANKVPAPHEIDDAWLIKHDWILRRVLLDDSFRPALEYLCKGFVGDELNLQILDNNVQAQRQVVDTIQSQVAAQSSVVQAAQGDLKTKMDAKGGLLFVEGFLGTVKNIFDPLHLTGQTATGTGEGADAIASYAQETLDRAEREKARLLDQLGVATTALQTAVDKLSTAIKEHYDKVAEIDRLRLHVKENILYYMQAIWNHEPPDQRYFRVFEIKVPVPVAVNGSTNINVPVGAPANALADALLNSETGSVKIPIPEIEVQWKPLVEIADLDNVLGYKGNYAIYRLKQNNCLTLHMMQDYIELSGELNLRDPDDFANFSIDELQELATCLYETDNDAYMLHKEDIRKLMVDRLTSGRAEDDRVIVPTKSLYIEALVGTHPLLEDFKLLHRALDVKKVQGEVRHAELENVRLAARAFASNLEDPDINKKIVIEGTPSSLAIQPDP